MSEVKYEMKQVTEKRPKSTQVRSKYDPMIDEFINSGQELVEITVEGKRPSYIVTQLKKRIDTRKLDIEASRGGGFIYLEKKQE